MLPRPLSTLFLALCAVAFTGTVAIAHEPATQALQAQGEPMAAATAAAELLRGTVREIVIDDATRATSTRYVELELDDGTLVPLHGDAVATLAKGARVEISGRRDGKSVEVEAAQTLVPGSPAGAATKSGVEAEGSLAMLHADDLAHGRSAYIYELHQSSGEVKRLRMGSLPAPLAPGMRLRVSGRIEADGESISPERITILARPAATSGADAALAKAATANSVLVIMANFNNTAAPSFTSAQAQQVMTTNTGSVANFFNEASYGQQLMNVTVTPGWVTMNLAKPSTCSSSDWTGIGSAAETAAKTLGAAYDPSAYNFVVYLYPNVPACGWTGLAYVGYPRKSWINGTGAFATSTIAHEMGHNFGLLHAGSLRCGNGAIIGGTCSVNEYGDPFDAMGNQRAMHYNAAQKAELAWIPPASVRTHAGGSVTYTLTPLEIGGGATYAVEIPTASANRTYWLEFRQPIGFDAPLSMYPSNGAEIRVSSPFETLCSGCDSWSNDTQMLDMTPGTPAFTDGTLPVGQTFSDPTYGVSVKVLSASASALTVQVATGGATTITSSSTMLTSALNPSFVGNSVTFSAAVTGSAPGGTVQFTADGASIAGCAASTLAGSGDTRTATCATGALATGTHAIVAVYSGDSSNTASTSTSITQVVNVAPGGSINVASATNGGVASASSTLRPANAVIYVNDNQRSGAGWSTGGGGWADATPGAFPDWVEIDFNGQETIDHVVVYSVQDNFQNPVEPTDAMTFTLYGLTAFDIQGWNGASWVTLGSVSGNNLVKRTVAFPAYTTNRIRIVANGVADGKWSRIAEIEAWTATSSATTANYALALNGGVASASSTLRPANAVIYVNDNRRSGAGWSTGGGGWADATPGAFPDWVEIDFSGQKSLDHVVVYSVQDNFQSPVEPTDAMTFTLYGLTAFDVQGWNGASWVTLGSVSGNNLVKRTVAFPAYTTNRIRIVANGVADGAWSRITEIEAWGN